jgi:hypothetical protein
MPRANRLRAIPESRCSKKVPARTKLYLCKETLYTLCLCKFRGTPGISLDNTNYNLRIAASLPEARRARDAAHAAGKGPLHLLLLDSLICVSGSTAENTIHRSV